MEYYNGVNTVREIRSLQTNAHIHVQQILPVQDQILDVETVDRYSTTLNAFSYITTTVTTLTV